jgi:hypothetical protein
VLRAIGIGGAVVVLGGAGAAGVRAETNGVWSVGRGEPWALWSGWADLPGTRGLAAAGTLAANPHNLQPWRLVTSATGLDLLDDATRSMPVSDPDLRERAVGYGALLENVVVAARSRGLLAAVQPYPDPSDHGHVAHVELTEGSAPGTADRALAAAISTRHSNRGPYLDEPVQAAALARLGAAGSLAASVVWCTDPAARAALGTLYVEATQAIIEDEEMSVEGYSWFRSDRRAVERHRDGLTLDCQGLSPMMLALAKIAPAESRTSGDAFWLKTTRDVHTATAAAYGVIRVEDSRDPAARIDGGRLLQRVHLAATAAGLALQHMNQVTERIDRDRALGLADRFGRRWSEAVGIPTEQTLVSFRIGHPQRTANPSPRRALADLVA